MNIIGPKIISLSVKHPPRLPPINIHEPQPAANRKISSRKSKKNQIPSPRPSYKINMLVKDLPIASPRPTAKRPVQMPSPPQSPRSPRQNANYAMLLNDKINYIIENPVVSPLVDFDKKVETLQQIMHILTKMEPNYSMLQQFLEPLVRMITIHIFQPLPKFSPFLLYSETKVAVSRQFWPALSIMYKALAFIIIKFSIPDLSPFITQDFIRNLMKILQSPDSNESLAAEDCITEIFDKFQKHQIYIFKIAASMLNAFIDGEISFIAVAPCIRLTHYYLIFNAAHHSDYASVACSLIAPLLSQHYSADFFDDCDKLILFLCDADPSLPLFFAQYFIAHFPQTDTNKMCLFLPLLERLFVRLPQNERNAVSAPFLSLISEGISSPNFKLNISALALVNRQFLSLFAPQTPARALMPAVNRAKSHWNDGVRDLAGAAAKILQDFDRGAVRAAQHQQEREAKREKEREMFWKTIAGI